MTDTYSESLASAKLLRLADLAKKSGKKQNPFEALVEAKDALIAKEAASLCKAGEDLSAPAKINPEDMERYKKMLLAMPDIRAEEVERVKGILDDGSYGKEALSAVVDRMLYDPV